MTVDGSATRLTLTPLPSEAELEDLLVAGRLDVPPGPGVLDGWTPPVVGYELPAERATEALVEAAESIRTVTATLDSP